VLNKASIEMATGLIDDAMRDYDIAEKLSGQTPTILTNKAVALTNKGDCSYLRALKK